MAFNRTFNQEEINRLKKLIQEGDQVLYEVEALTVGLRETVKAIAEEMELKPSILNKAIYGAGGPRELLTAPLTPTMDTSKVIMSHKDVRILVVTGGEAVVEVAMKSGKKVIAAGPGNPPVIVDDTANIKKAAYDVLRGASFDNNILCIAEKEAFVLNSVLNEFKSEMQKHGAYELKNREIDQVTNELFTKNKNGETVVNRKYVGKSAGELLKACNIPVHGDVKLIIAEVMDNHPFITVEMLMPVLGIVKVYSVDESTTETEEPIDTVSSSSS